MTRLMTIDDSKGDTSIRTLTSVRGRLANVRIPSYVIRGSFLLQSTFSLFPPLYLLATIQVISPMPLDAALPRTHQTGARTRGHLQDLLDQIPSCLSLYLS